MDFIRAKISQDIETGKYGGRVRTRFPPEPNGFLHIGHAKAICLNFGIAGEHAGGRCHLRFDDTNPDTEKAEYAEAMARDIRWLGFDWGEHLHHASDYFEQLYEHALRLVDKGRAYVDDSTEAEIRRGRGSLTQPGRNSAHRDRLPAENRDLFERMRAGEFADGSRVLRAKIDMAHPNMVMRDPVLYRIRHARHYRRGDEWPIYPLYDFAHCLSDSLEGITHSLCTLEFENNREIYDWLLEHADVPRPRPEQTEFARLALEHVVTSKRKLRPLVERGAVRGWDDPRMFTLAGLRRRGVTPEAIRKLCEMVGVTKAQSMVDLGKFEFAVRDDLERKAPRAFCVLDPLRVVLAGAPRGDAARFSAPAFPGAPGARATEVRSLAVGGELYIDRDDFSEDPPPGFRRLVPDGRVRLKYAGVICCRSVVRDGAGDVVELRCDWEGEGGDSEDGPRPRAAIHWVSAADAAPAEVRLYDRLFSVRDPAAAEDLESVLSPDSERVMARALVESGVAGARPGSRYQFERLGYFVADSEDCRADRLVFNRTVALRSSWKRDGGPKASRAGRSSAGRGAAVGGQREVLRGGGATAGGGREALYDGDAAAGGRREVLRDGGAAGDGYEARRDGGAAAGGRREVLRDGGATRRFEELTALGAGEAAALAIAKNPALDDLFRAARACYPEGGASLAAWVANEVSRLVAGAADGAARLEPEALAALAQAVDEDELSHRQGRVVLEALVEGGGSYENARKRTRLEEVGDPEAIEPVARALLAEHPAKVAAYRSGQRGLLGFFVGQVLQRTGGAADPRAASALLRAMLLDDEDSPD